jgi:hypothetical protein
VEQVQWLLGPGYLSSVPAPPFNCLQRYQVPSRKLDKKEDGFFVFIHSFEYYSTRFDEGRAGTVPALLFYIPPVGLVNYTYLGKLKENRHCLELGIFVKFSIK